MEIIKDKWRVSKKEYNRLQELDKSDLMAIIKGLKLGTKKAEKDVYNSIKTQGKSKKVHVKRSSKSS